MSETITIEVDDTTDPSMVLTFDGRDGSKVEVTVTVSVEGDIRQYWEGLDGLSERGALHWVAEQLFKDMTRDPR